MFENIGNTITRIAMDQLGRNLADRIPSRQGIKYCAVIHKMCCDNLRLWSDKRLFVQ